MLVFVTNRPKEHEKLISHLLEHAIYPYICPYETAAFICDRKDTGGVLLDGIAALPYAERLCEQLREQYPEMPIAAIVAPLGMPNMPISRIIWNRPSTDVAEEALDFCIRNCAWNTQSLSTFYLSVDSDPRNTYYMGYPLPLTKTEHAILRFLFYRSPRLTSADDIFQLCFPLGGCRAHGIPLHIHNINKRAALIDERPLIVNTYGKGYRLRDGVLG